MSNKYDHYFLAEVRQYIEASNRTRGPYGLQIVLERDPKSTKFNPRYDVMIYVEDNEGNRMWRAIPLPITLGKGETVHIKDLAESFRCTFS